uniref:Uncharacterized protein n=1 Tax=Lepeophtheirus salmonis TaxID=72036 RepID=A0A0K2TSB2_LEPSM
MLTVTIIATEIATSIRVKSVHARESTDTLAKRGLPLRFSHQILSSSILLEEFLFLWYRSQSQVKEQLQ